MKLTKKAVRAAYQRAITLAGERWLKKDGEKWKLLMIIEQALRPEVLSRLRPAFKKLAREPEQLDTRQRILIGYLNIVHNRNRFPYVREIQTHIKDRWGFTLDKRVIRRICDELSLPRTSRHGQPKRIRTK